MKDIFKIQKDLMISTLFFLDKFYFSRAFQEKLEEQLNSIWDNIQGVRFTWKDTPYRSMRELKTSFYHPALLRCIISMIEAPKILVPQFFPDFFKEVFQVDNKDIQCQSMAIQVQEPASGDTLLSLRISDHLTEKILKLQEDHTSFDFLCCTLPFPTSVGKAGIHLSPYLAIMDIRPVTSPLQLIQAEDKDISIARKTLEEAKDSGGVFNYIRNKIIRNIRIVNLERNKSLDLALSAVIIQAFSDGWIQNASGKISCLIAGAPGSGKKLISRCAQALNPVFTVGEPSKLSIAGICSSTQKRADVWISRPGLIPLAHLGTFNLQDFHIISPAKKKAIIGALYRVLEDGIVIDSTASQITHQALTSILIDVNKSSDLRPERENNGVSIIERRLNDIDMPLPLLSRFDFVVDIPRDINQQIDIALKVHKRMTFKADHTFHKSEWEKQLKVLVGYLRQQHRNRLEFPKEIRDYIKARHTKLIEEYRPLMVQYEHFSDFIIRLVISIYRFTAAISIMNDRNKPAKDDVDFAFQFVDQKMAFIKSLVEEIEAKKIKTDRPPKRKERQKWLLKYFAGSEIKIGYLAKEFEKYYGIKIDKMALRLDLQGLEEIGVKPTHLKGYYYIPEKREQRINT